jgi:DNA (cytosine-5)-methyltransferase 1
MNKPRALDLFCCAGGATRGLQQAGFHVTGVDHNPQPRYVGDRFVQADALTFPLEGYDFIWASPPCQAFSSLRALQKAKSYPNLIPQTRARLMATWTPWCIENVERAPLGDSGNLIMLCGTMFGLRIPSGDAELRRHRCFETSFPIVLRPECRHGVPISKVITITGHTPVEPRSQLRTISVVGQKGLPGLSHARAAIITVAGTHARNSKACNTSQAENRMVRTVSITGSTPQTNVVRNRERRTFTTAEAGYAMGIDWMTMKGLSQAIPPAYAKFIGDRAMQVILKSGQGLESYIGSGTHRDLESWEWNA